MSRVISARGRGGLAAGAAVLALAAMTGMAGTAGAAAHPTAAPKWHIVKSVKTDFGGQFTAVVATGKTTGWAFDGNGESGVKATAWRETGTGWTRIAFPSAAGEQVVAAGADAPNDVWAFTQNFGGASRVSATNVYALGSGGTQDEGGPLVVLHFNGHTWTKVASGQFGAGPGPQFSYDGAGGLWLPMDGPVGGTSFLVHYAAGKLTKATLPVSAPQVTIGAVGRIPGTAAQLAGGFTHKAGDRGTGVVAVLLQYS